MMLKIKFCIIIEFGFTIGALLLSLIVTQTPLQYRKSSVTVNAMVDSSLTVTPNILPSPAALRRGINQSNRTKEKKMLAGSPTAESNHSHPCQCMVYLFIY